MTSLYLLKEISLYLSLIIFDNLIIIEKNSLCHW